MFSVQTIISGQSTKSRHLRSALRDAQDDALRFYRARFMHMHFKSYAPGRYGAEFSKKPGRPGPSRHRRGGDRRQRPNAGQPNRDRGNKRPLFRTGKLQMKMLRGGVKFSGRWDRRKIRYNPPYYLHMSSPGQLDKYKALSAITRQESRAVEEHCGKKFNERMGKQKTTVRG